MRSLKNLLGITLLTLALGTTTLAGDVQTPGSPEPTPSPAPPPAANISQPCGSSDSVWDSLTLGLLSELF